MPTLLDVRVGGYKVGGYNNCLIKIFAPQYQNVNIFILIADDFPL